jgi:hypothetical protein
MNVVKVRFKSDFLEVLNLKLVIEFNPLYEWFPYL